MAYLSLMSCCLKSPEPKECDALGIEAAVENSVSKMEFMFQQKSKEIGMYSDGAAVNHAVYNLLHGEMGGHYLLTCPTQKFELAINDAFSKYLLSGSTESDYSDGYYFLKKSPLHWLLLKRQSIFLNIPHKRYKRLTGSRWVEH